MELAFNKTAGWGGCYHHPPMWINVSSNMQIIDWAGNQSNIGQEMSTGLLQSDSDNFQRHIWKLAAALYEVVKNRQNWGRIWILNKC